ncbi:MAG: thioredoxin domain-containing protein [Tateyamaria sp.]|uniref:thioredoxin domain-containing protein n=1 Tax=Tateyamaria sp. TaxID=1929288 RepID=UPI00329BB9AD
MSKSRSKARKAKAKAPVAPTPRTRRDMLRLGGYGAAAAVGVVGVGFWGASSFSAYGKEHDLSRVGEAPMTVVQIHDPQCPTCTALQKQTRAALRDFDEGEITYLIADIKTPEGAAFARKYRVPHVTLLLFDKDGELQQTIQGLQQASQLSETFATQKAALR